MAKGQKGAADTAAPKLKQIIEPELRRLAASDPNVTYEINTLAPRRHQLVVVVGAEKMVLENPSWFETTQELDLAAVGMGLRSK